MPDPVRDVLDAAAPTDRARLLAGIDQASTATSFTSAVDAAERLISLGQDPAGPGLGMLARRLAGGSQPADTGVDLTVYDLVARNTRTQPAQTPTAQVGA